MRAINSLLADQDAAVLDLTFGRVVVATAALLGLDALRSQEGRERQSQSERQELHFTICHLVPLISRRSSGSTPLLRPQRRAARC